MKGTLKTSQRRKDKAPLVEARPHQQIPEPAKDVAPISTTAAALTTPPPASAMPEVADRTPCMPEPLPQTKPTQEPVPLSAWQLCGDAVIGLAHRRKGLPCQDAVALRTTTRPILALSDGAGSAAVSELGAQALVTGITRFLMSLEDDLAPWLDEAETTDPAHARHWAGRLLRHAQGLLDDLARSERRSVRDLRGTLLLAVMGERQAFWWQVGDGAIVVRHANGLNALGTPANTKGEFANQTCFVDMADIGMVQYGVLSTPEVIGLALMSDGGAEKLVAHDGSRVSVRIGEWLDAVAGDRFPPDKIALAFHEPAMWERTTLDDRSVVLAARNVQTKQTTPVRLDAETLPAP